MLCILFIQLPHSLMRKLILKQSIFNWKRQENINKCLKHLFNPAYKWVEDIHIPDRSKNSSNIKYTFYYTLPQKYKWLCQWIAANLYNCSIKNHYYELCACVSVTLPYNGTNATGYIPLQQFKWEVFYFIIHL